MFRTFATVLLALISTSPAQAAPYRDRSVPMSVVTTLDVERYLGMWYEIARFPNRFEKGCQGVTAEYAQRADGKINVLNTCHQGSVTGPVKQAEGKATVAGPGKLVVSFVSWLPFAKGDYWVLWVDPGYTLAVVGEPKGRTGWILARNPQISAAAYDDAVAVLRENGYDVSKLVKVAQ